VITEHFESCRKVMVTMFPAHAVPSLLAGAGRAVGARQGGLCRSQPRPRRHCQGARIILCSDAAPAHAVHILSNLPSLPHLGWDFFVMPDPASTQCLGRPCCCQKVRCPACSAL